MRVRLKVAVGNAAPINWEHVGGPAILGRLPDCDLPLFGVGTEVVSGRHARLEPGPSRVLLHDAGARNGTFLNGRRIDGPAEIHPGDVIRLGQSGPILTVVELEADAAKSSSPVLPRVEPQPVPPPPAAPAPLQFSDDTTSDARSAPPKPKAVPSMSKTRAMLAVLQHRQQRLLWVAIGAVALLLLGGGTVAVWVASRDPGSEGTATDGGDPDAAGVLTGREVYERVLPSVVWILSPTGPGTASAGSGSLVDRGRRLVITNEHVVEDRRGVVVFFPERDTAGEPIQSREYYSDHENLAIRGEVLATDATRDLALIRLERLPSTATELPLAARSTRAGEKVYLVGNTGSGGLWSYISGEVRGVGPARQLGAVGRAAQFGETRVVDTTLAANQGDSGSPVVNRRGEMVAVLSSGELPNPDRPLANLITTCVDLSEVRAFLKARSP